MNIVIYTPSARIGGVQIWSFSYFRELLKQNQTVTLFSGETGTLINSLSKEEKESISIGSTAKLISFLGENNTSVLHLPSQTIDYGMGYIKKLFPKIRVIVTCHGAIPLGWNNTNCDHIISCAPWLINSSSISTKTKVASIVNGVNCNDFNFIHSSNPNTKPVIMWVGRADDPVKGFELFLELLPDIKKLGFDIWVVSGTAMSTIKNILAMKNIDKWMSLPYSSMPGIYREVANSGGALLMTSKREGLPMVAIEAQACGCPLVGPSHTGIYDASINKELLYTVNKKENILLAINSIFKPNIRLKDELSIQTSAKFNLEKMTTLYLGYYKNHAREICKLGFIDTLKHYKAKFLYQNISFKTEISKNLELIIIDLINNDEKVLAEKLESLK